MDEEVCCPTVGVQVAGDQVLYERGRKGMVSNAAVSSSALRTAGGFHFLLDSSLFQIIFSEWVFLVYRGGKVI